MATQSVLMLDWIDFRRDPKSRETKPWVALITGFHPRYELARQFVKAKLDLSECDKKGRGARLAFYLYPGLYEACDYHREKKTYSLIPSKRFIHATDGEIIEITKRKLTKCLEEQNRGWVLMS